MGESTKTAHEFLQDFHLPPELLPNGVLGYEWNPETGEFCVKIANPVYRDIGPPDDEKVHYATEIKGIMKDLKLLKLKGVKTKQALVWMPVTKIVRDSPTSDAMNLTAGVLGVTITKTLKIESFKDHKERLAKSKEPED